MDWAGKAYTIGNPRASTELNKKPTSSIPSKLDHKIIPVSDIEQTCMLDKTKEDAVKEKIREVQKEKMSNNPYQAQAASYSPSNLTQEDIIKVSMQPKWKILLDSSFTISSFEDM